VIEYVATAADGRAVRVTRVQVQAAQMMVRRLRKRGSDVPDSLIALAAARPQRHDETLTPRPKAS
jgi:hypothetical protein